MGIAAGLALLALLLVAALAVVASVSAERLAAAIRFGGPALMVGFGGLLTLTGRVALGIPLIGFGLALFAKNRPATGAGGGGSRRSTVRAAMFEMELDHDSGEMDGTVLTGPFEGRSLSDLSREDLLELLRQSDQDGESRALLEAYLDRRMAGWRDDPQADSGARHAGATGAGPMTKEEAYQVLGLQPGAAPQDIREAHRRLMKRLHPDSGGSTFLASKINEAKDTLLG